MKSISIAAVLAATLGASGCFWVTTKSEGASLRTDVKDLDVRLTTKEGEIDTQVGELQKVLDEATKVLKRNSADLGADVDALRNDIRVSTGLVSAAKNMMDDLAAQVERYKTSNDERLGVLEARLAALEGGRGGAVVAGGTTTAVAGMNPDDLWTQGTEAFKASKWDDARDAYKKLAVGFPSHARADDAQYFRGESYFQQQDWDSAIREFQKVYDKFATSDLADDALFRAAEAATKLKNCSEARAYLSLMKQKYASSSLLKKAATMDKDLKASAKTKSKCTS
ncbi:MAG: tetratricopeptide repeat protein [Myxococcales bacterium]|nr:tetratricopeptide repeat protein [Myxococcales bacterium]